MSVNLGTLSQKSDFLAQAPAWCQAKWRNPKCFESFLKLNRAVLTEHGALMRLGRDYFIVTERFPEVAWAILRREPVPQAEVAA